MHVNFSLPPVVPGVVAAESSVAAYMGESVVLSCLVSGASISDLVWYHGGQVGIPPLPPSPPLLFTSWVMGVVWLEEIEWLITH